MTLNDLGPKFEKGGKDVKRMKESAVLREKEMMGSRGGDLSNAENDIVRFRYFDV